MAPRRRVFEERSVSLERLWCLTGTVYDGPVPLPAVQVDGRWCVPLGAHQPWLHFAAGGRHRDAQVVARMSAFMDEAVEVISRTSSQSTESESATPTKQGGGAPKGRAALGLSDDSDEEALAAGTMPSGGAARASPAKRSAGAARASPEWIAVQVGGQSWTLRRRRGMGLWMPVDSDDLSRLVSLMKTGPEPVTDSEPSPAKRPRRDHAQAPEDSGRIKWNHQRSGWLLTYLDESGQQRYFGQGLRVPSHGEDGRELTPEEFSRLRRRLLERARALWNEKDRSELPRYAADLGDGSSSDGAARASPGIEESLPGA